MAEVDLRARELELEYRSFLDDEATDGVYKGRVEAMIKKGDTRLVVRINDIRKNPNFKDRAQGLIDNSVEEIVAFQRALKEYVISLNPAYGRSKFEYNVGLCGSFGRNHVTPRTVSSSFLNQTICVEGIVNKVSLVKPKILKSVLYCPSTKKRVERRHYDLSSLDYQAGIYPVEGRDDDGNPLELEAGLSIYKDHQQVTIQEMPESSPPGQLPRSVDIVLESDLVDSCKPGDRIKVVGSYRCMPNKQGNFSNGVFRAIIIANYVEQMSKEVSMSLTEDDINACKKISKTRKFDIFERLSQSLAPSVRGHERVKKALLCLLLGGVEKTLSNGSRLRGDINVLLIGDPSVAKSQLLRYILCCAPRAIATTGRGSSGVGLTAAITTDPDSGDRRIEAGAMVLADRGVVCVDEFDKMSDIDRTAMHEVMEQGKVTLCKAGIQARLNARCSVLAAANPVFGNYDIYKQPMENIGMQDSLLSRFDLVFVMLDEKDRKSDEKIAKHVVGIHRYRPKNELDGEPSRIHSHEGFLTTFVNDNECEKTEIFEKYNPTLNASQSARSRFFTIDFIRKYIHIAKRIKPTLTDDAAALIGEYYPKLRDNDQKVSNLAKTQPITARALETMIRLATAHAKARLSTTVEAEDAEHAINLLQETCYQKVLVKPRAAKRKTGGDSDSEHEELHDEDTCTSAAEAGGDNGASTRKRRRPNQEDGALMEIDEQATDTNNAGGEVSADEPIPSFVEKEALKEKLPLFQEMLNELSRKAHGASVLDLDLVYDRARGELDKRAVDVLLSIMTDESLLFLSNGTIYFTD